MTVSSGRWVTVQPWQSGVVVRDGVVGASAGPGRHRRRRRSTWHLVDSRPSILTIPTQEVLTLDGVQIRLSVVATVTVANAAAWVTRADDPLAVVYTALQVMLRDRVAATQLADIAATRSTLLAGVDDELVVTAASVGATITAVALKDITLPQEVRAALAETALAKQRGLAELERARSQAASMRSLANTAKLIEEHPALLQLRTLQAASEGAQVIIHRDDVIRHD